MAPRAGIAGACLGNAPILKVFPGNVNPRSSTMRCILSLLLAFFLSVSTALAAAPASQPPAAPAKQQPAAAAPAAPAKQLAGDLTLAEAQAIVSAALAFSVKQGDPMNIAVVDAGGNLKAFSREDGAFLGSIDIAQKKALTARYFNMSTAALGAASQPGKELYGIEVTNGGLIIFGGGELLIRKDAIVGAIGVSGGSVAEDTAVAKAGAAALK
jgi:uncharacterized protein GlcG (DUF336 family)